MNYLCLALGLATAAGVIGAPAAVPAEEPPPCGTMPEPPLLVVLPDGSEVPAARLTYATDARTIHVVSYPRIFCDGVEGGLQ